MDIVVILLVVLLIFFLLGGVAYPRPDTGYAPFGALLWILAAVILIVLVLKLLGVVL